MQKKKYRFVKDAMQAQMDNEHITFSQSRFNGFTLNVRSEHSWVLQVQMWKSQQMHKTNYPTQ